MTATVGCALVAYGVSGWLVWALWGQIRTGRIAWIPWSFRWPRILRAEQPLSFWATVAGQLLGLFVVAFFDFILTYAALTSISN
jgi:hypothetical protein